MEGFFGISRDLERETLIGTWLIRRIASRIWQFTKRIADLSLNLAIWPNAKRAQGLER
jgi:hypothetical protein